MLRDTIEWLAIFQNSENFPDVQVLGTRRQMCDLNCVKFHLKIIQQKFKIVFAFACHFVQSNASQRLGTRQEAQRFFFLTSKSQELTKRIRKKHHGKSMCSGKVEILCSHSCFGWTLRVFPSQATSRGFDRHDFLPGWDQMILDSPWFTSAYESWETHLYEKEGRWPDRKSESPRQCTLSVAVVASLHMSWQEIASFPVRLNRGHFAMPVRGELLHLPLQPQCPSVTVTVITVITVTELVELLLDSTISRCFQILRHRNCMELRWLSDWYSDSQHAELFAMFQGCGML